MDTNVTPVIHHRNLPLLLLQSREAVLARFRPLLNQQGVTEQQWRVIRALDEVGPMEPRQIGSMCCISSPSMAGILARMDDMGLISRQRMEQDQRRVLVAVTPKGQQTVAALAPLIESCYQDIEAVIGADFTHLLYDMLDALTHSLNAGRGGESAAGDGD